MIGPKACVVRKPEILEQTVRERGEEVLWVQKRIW